MHYVLFKITCHFPNYFAPEICLVCYRAKATTSTDTALFLYMYELDKDCVPN